MSESARPDESVIEMTVQTETDGGSEDGPAGVQFTADTVEGWQSVLRAHHDNGVAAAREQLFDTLDHMYRRALNSTSRQGLPAIESLEFELPPYARNYIREREVGDLDAEWGVSSVSLSFRDDADEEAADRNRESEGEVAAGTISIDTDAELPESHRDVGDYLAEKRGDTIDPPLDERRWHRVRALFFDHGLVERECELVSSDDPEADESDIRTRAYAQLVHSLGIPQMPQARESWKDGTGVFWRAPDYEYNQQGTTWFPNQEIIDQYARGELPSDHDDEASSSEGDSER